MSKAGHAAASGSPLSPRCPPASSAQRLGDFPISSWLRLWHTWPLAGCEQRLLGLPARQTSRPWHQVGNSELKAVPEGFFFPFFSFCHINEKQIYLCPSHLAFSFKAPGREGLLKSRISVHNVVLDRGFCQNTSASPSVRTLPFQGLLFLALLLHSLHPKALAAQKATGSSSAECPQVHRAFTGD